MRITDKYTFFWRSKLGQWNMLPFNVDGVKYNCAEQYMMAQKAKLFNDIESYELIMKEKSPRNHQALGRKIKNFDEEVWKNHREEIVYTANIAKFSQNPELLEMLLRTPDTTFVEASPYDKIWGVGLGEDDPLIDDEKNWKGLNLLGKTLTRVRDDLVEKLS